MSAAAPELRKSIMYYLHSGAMHNFCLTSGLMEQKRAPFFKDPQGQLNVWDHFGYHIDNKKFLTHLEKVSLERGIEIVEADVL